MSYDTLVASTARAYWRMTYGGGTEPDAAGGDDPGTWQSANVTAFTLSSSGAPLAGDSGDNGIRLHGDAVAERMDVPTLNGDAIFSGGFTLEAWHREPAGVGGGDMCIMGWWVGGAGGPMLYIDASRHYRLTTHITFSDYLDSGAALTGSVWNHVVGTFDGTTFRLYVNGALVDSKLFSAVGIGGSPTIPFRVGAYGSPVSGGLNGQLASAAVYQRALSAAEVTQRYNLGRTDTGVVLDSFNRADGALGANWGAPATGGSGYAALQIATNAVRVPSGGLTEGQAYWLPTTFGADQYASFTLAARSTINDAVYLILCLTSPGTGAANCYLVNAVQQSDPSNVTFNIYKEVSGGYTLVATAGGTLPVGSTFGFEKVGGALTVRVDGVPVLTYTDPSPFIGGAIGFGMSDTGTSRIERIDDFGGGGVVELFPTTGVLDDFNRSDRMLDGWLSPIFVGQGTFSIIGNRVTNASGSWQNAYWPTAFGADQEIYATYAGGLHVELLLRLQNPNSGGMNAYYLYADAFAGTLQILKMVSGAQSGVSGAFSKSLAVGDKLGLRVVGSRLDVLHKPVASNWAVLFTVTDTSVTGGGFVGFAADNVSIDDVGGGTSGVVGIVYTDTGSGVQPHVGGAADATSLAETASGIVVLVASAADATSLTETGTGTSPRTAGGSKVVVTGGVVYTKTVLGIVTLVGSAPAGIVYTKTASGVVTLVGSAVDVSLHAETGSGVLVRSGRGASSVTSTVVPNAPTELIANVDGKNILLTWAVPVDTSSYVSMETGGHVVMENAGGEVLLETSASELFVVAHYNVHRSKNAGFALSSSNMIAQPTGTSYVDVVPNEGTYHYKVTAVNASGGVSSASNEVIAVVVSVGRALSLGPAFELELIGKNALELIKQHLDDEIAMQEDKWASLDSHFGYKDLTIERIDALNYYHGHRPSLIDAPPENYPNVCVMAWQANAQPELLDEFNRYLVNLFAEIMCKSETDEEEVNSRIQRTAEAVHACVMKDRSLGGIVFEVRDTPNVLLTDVFARPEVRGHGERFYWQGARLEYAVEKFARI